VVIDASSASAVEAHLQWCLDHGADFLIGTTGWSIPDLAARVGDRIGVITAPNFSLTVALYARLSLILARFAALDEQRDPYLVEHHHARKHDAPSGTAKLLAGVLMEGCPRKTGWAIPAAGGDLQPHQLNVSSIRAGHTYSSHIVGLDAPGEVLELHHAARSARPYAEGALVAAQWIRGRKGLFTMDQVAKDVLDPLFAGARP
jgi:4-hydroxy-tetrahydrodipicolinate reductase